ncbi:hypothetical protein DOTSEDRAFT_48669 [Dothistroma septosporum NZE10]|uniref:Uncharacterized protein n=1 Tax=Dothistroma septosporum (strain NZE10 / CBS 128990) TaxID=675120 RepID=N1PE54_DOTSN|nr:hypothetical protein DOTSEDRAFT_48669 [Dothistroma septosporum NZE10]
MSHMSPIHPTFARHVECACTTCTSLRDVRGGITSIPIQHMIAMYGEQEAANRIIEADHLLGEAQEVLRRKHVPGPYSSMSNNALTGRERSGASVSPPKSARDSAISIIRDATENRMSPVRSRQVTNGWQGAGTPPANTGKTASTFEDVVRSRAAELGILRTQQASVLERLTTASSRQHQRYQEHPQREVSIHCL